MTYFENPYPDPKVDKEVKFKKDLGEGLCDRISRNGVEIGLMSPEDIDRFVDLGGDINYKDSYGKTPLMIASTVGNEQVVRKLISLNVNINLPKGHFSALYYASIYGHFKIVKMLLDAGATK